VEWNEIKIIPAYCGTLPHDFCYRCGH
jgi:hypothetical protein